MRDYILIYNTKIRLKQFSTIIRCISINSFRTRNIFIQFFFFFYDRRPSQKSPIPLNRYDDFVDDLSHRSRSQEQTPEPRLVARALYNFIGQSCRELNFRRGDIIFVRRQVDKNWYEGEHNAMIGLFPSNYVEVIPLRSLFQIY